MDRRQVVMLYLVTRVKHKVCLDNFLLETILGGSRFRKPFELKKKTAWINPSWCNHWIPWHFLRVFSIFFCKARSSTKRSQPQQLPLCNYELLDTQKSNGCNRNFSCTLTRKFLNHWRLAKKVLPTTAQLETTYVPEEFWESKTHIPTLSLGPSSRALLRGGGRARSLSLCNLVSIPSMPVLNVTSLQPTRRAQRPWLTNRQMTIAVIK